MRRRRSAWTIAPIAFAAFVGACGAAAQVHEPARPPASPARVAPDGAASLIVRVDQVQLVEPAQFWVRGALRDETSLALVVLRLSSPPGLFPRGGSPDQLLLDDVPTRLLVPPPLTSYVAVVAPMPERPLEQALLWRPVDRIAAERITPARLRARREAYDASHPHSPLRLSAAIRGGSLSADVRHFASLDDLAQYARQLVAEIEKVRP